MRRKGRGRAGKGERGTEGRGRREEGRGIFSGSTKTLKLKNNKITRKKIIPEEKVR